MYDDIDFDLTDTSGFYHPGFQLRAGQFVITSDFELTRAAKDSFSYPVGGWTWYESVFLAIEATGIPLNEWNLDLVDPVLKETT